MEPTDKEKRQSECVKVDVWQCGRASSADRVGIANKKVKEAGRSTTIRAAILPVCTFDLPVNASEVNRNGRVEKPEADAESKSWGGGQRVEVDPVS